MRRKGIIGISIGIALVLIAACAPVQTPPPSPQLTVVTPSPIQSTATIPPTPTVQTEKIPERSESMKIKMTLADTVITATLADNEAARDFTALLPLTMTLNDYGRNEKVSDLPRTLSTEGVPAGHDPSIGDITYYAPWGNLAIFIGDFGYADGLVYLGRIDGDSSVLNIPGPIDVSIEQVE